MLFQSPMATENCKSAPLPRKMCWNKPVSTHSLIPPSECAAEPRHCLTGQHRLQSPERRGGRSNIQIAHQSTHRLSKQIKKAIGSQIPGCFLLRGSPPSPCFEEYPVSLQIEILGALGSFQQSKMWSLCGGCINKRKALCRLEKNNITYAWGS